jgi:uncharacterized integral membrane protein (TIGR00698 family)
MTLTATCYRSSVNANCILRSLASRTRGQRSYPQRNNDVTSIFYGQHRSMSTPSFPSPKDDDAKDTNNTSTKRKLTTSTATATTTSTADVASAVSKPSILPGLGVAASTAFGGFTMAAATTSAFAIPLSGIPVSIMLGMSIKNLVLSPSTDKDGNDATIYVPNDTSLKPGLTFATKTVLQTGIVAAAAKLSFVQLVTTGASCLPVVVASVGTGLTVIPMLARAAGLPTQMSLLLTAGTSICGVTAITALSPGINACNRDIAVAVANTVAFGTVGMLAYPYLFNYLAGASPEQVGMCLGVGIHDTSQVLGAALSYKETFGDEVAFQTAAVTKLIRNLGLAVSIPLLTYSYQKEIAAQEEGDKSNKKESLTEKPSLSGLNTFSKYIPPFLYAFLGMSALRTGGDLALTGDALAIFSQGMDFIGNDVSKYALGTAMAGVGLSTSASSLRGVGWKPFAVGGAGALVVGGTGFTVASMMV